MHDDAVAWRCKIPILLWSGQWASDVNSGSDWIHKHPADWRYSALPAGRPLHLKVLYNGTRPDLLRARRIGKADEQVPGETL